MEAKKGYYIELQERMRKEKGKRGNGQKKDKEEEK